MLQRERIIRDRTNPLSIYDDSEFIARFRFTKATVIALNEMTDCPLAHIQMKGNSVSLLLQVLVVLRFNATGKF